VFLENYLPQTLDFSDKLAFFYLIKRFHTVLAAARRQEHTG
jgi:hypothetical protein